MFTIVPGIAGPHVGEKPTSERVQRHDVELDHGSIGGLFDRVHGPVPAEPRIVHENIDHTEVARPLVHHIRRVGRGEILHQRLDADLGVLLRQGGVGPLELRCIVRHPGAGGLRRRQTVGRFRTRGPRSPP